ncbi:MAG: hypothetical protein JWN67_1884, partial [Actinomycetia bacterium]|nr:hypothetical protein [Actinomycetes bacterium]
GSVPRRVLLDGEPAVSANATSWWVDPAHRRHSLQLLARFTAAPACGHFNTTAAAATHEALEAFGFERFGADDRESLLVVDPVRVAAARIAALGPLGRIAAPLGRVVQRARLPRAPRSHQGERLARAEAGLDALSAAMGGRHRFTAGRDAESTDWFLRGSEPRAVHLVVARARGRVLGAAVLLERESGSRRGLPVLDCLDLATERDDADIVTTLLATTVDLAADRGIPLVVVRHQDAFLADVCARLGLPTRAGPARREFVRLPDGVDRTQAHLTQLHGDFAV